MKTIRFYRLPTILIITISLLFIPSSDNINASPLRQASSQLILMVNSNLDDSDTSPGDGVCMTSASLCTFRAALQETNAIPNTYGIDEIHFNLPSDGTKPYEIKRYTIFPFINDPIIIDGTTQPGYAGIPLIVLQGVFRDEDGLTINAGNSTIRGLQINSFHYNGIYITSGNSNVIEGNYIGTNGISTMGNLKDGIRIENSSNNLIGGTTPSAKNVIAGNPTPTGTGYAGVAGIHMLGSGANSNIIQGNIIGLLANGVSIGSNRWGVVINDGSNNIIGGTTPAARNIISGNHADGIMVGGTNALNNVIQGNYIGTDITGTLARGNNGSGIYLFGNLSSVIIGGDVGVTPGGPCTGACNIISANYAGAGIESEMGSAQNVTIQGNYIGTDVTGTIAFGQQQEGMKLSGIQNWLIGGNTPGTGNLISGNTREGISLAYGSNNVIKGNLIGTDITGNIDLGNARNGIELSGTNNANNRIENNTISGNTYRGIGLSSAPHDIVIVGNRIGTNLSGTQPLGNTLDGIHIVNGTYNVTVGGINPADQNIIAYNNVGIYRSNVVGVTILGNSIFSNTGLGISGSEYSYNFRIDDVQVGANTNVEGLFTSGPNQTYRLEFFSNNTCDASDTGEGQIFLYASNITTNSEGAAPFNVTIPTVIAGNQFITMTATANGGSGSTTQFSRCAAVIEADISISKIVDYSTRDEGDSLTYSITVTNNGPDAAANILVRDQLPPGVTYTSDDSGGTYNPTTGVWNISGLAKNGSQTLNLTAIVKSGTLNTTFTNTASVTNLDQKDPYPLNQSSSIPVAVGANLGISLAVDTPYPVQGSNVIFTIQVTNSGPGSATNVHIQDLLPAGLTYLSNNPSQGTYTSLSGDWFVGTVVKNNTATLTITASVDNGIPNQVMVNTASVSQSDYIDPVLTNNNAAINLAISGSNLAVTKSVDRTAPDEGDTIIYTVVAKNLGPNPVDNVTVNDLLPAGLTFVSSSATSGSYDALSGIWTIGHLNAVENVTLQITATVNDGSGGTAKTNSAAISSSTSNDLTLTNNQAQVVINVRPPFSCTNIQLNNVAINSSGISWTIVNSNPQSAQLTKSYLVWSNPDLSTVPGLGLISQAMGTNVYWTGSDPNSPTDSTNAVDGNFNTNANRLVQGSSSLNWTASFTNLPASLTSYMTIWDLAGTLLYFDHPRQASDCAIPLTLPVQPPIYNVNTTADTNDGVCDAQCSLREAVIAANAHPGATVVIPAGTYTLTRSGANENAAATGDLDLKDRITIIGAGANATIIDGNGIDRVFHIAYEWSSPEVLIKNLTIRGGNANVGGGVYNTNSTTTLLNVVVSNNTSTGNAQSALNVSGGGIANDSGIMNIVSSDIRNNQSINLNARGGGIANMNSGITSIVNTTIRQNTGTSGGGGIAGNRSNGNSAISITGSSIYGNTGDGIYSSYQIINLTNSTISGNTGAGIMHTDNAYGSINLNQVTISNNGDGGLKRFGAFGDFYLRNTIIAGNTSGGVGQDCIAVDITSQGYNLIGNTSGCTFPTGQMNELLNVNPLLAPLSNNSGPSLTHALQAGSPAIDAIPASQCGTTGDQRGIKRPQMTGCDIGAFELQGPANNPMVFRVNSYEDTGDGKLDENESTSAHIMQFQVTFSKNMANPVGDSGANDVTNPANYRLLTAGANHTIQTTTCAALSGDDGSVAVNSVYYNSITYSVNLDVNDADALPADSYRLLVCGTLEDLQGMKLDGNIDDTGGDDFTRNFTVIGLPPTSITVNSTTDAVDANPGDGICATTLNLCTLRAAIIEANNLSGANSISLPAGNYVLSLAGQNEDAAETGDLDITDNVNILGADAATTVIDSNALDRIFHITGAYTVNISDITIQNGEVGNDEGGGIFNVSGVLNLSYTVITQNHAGGGGGIRNIFGGKVTLTNSIVSNNSSDVTGGGIHNDLDSQLDVTNSLIVGNTTHSEGAGVYNWNGTFTIINSTIADNHALEGDGGGLFSVGSSLTNISFTTIVGNTAQNYGGGIAVSDTGVVVNLTTTILAQNTSNIIGKGNCGATSLHSNGFNISDDQSCQYVLTQAGDRNQTNPKLGPLGDYGGFTSTHNVLFGSPAIDAVSPILCTVTIDQRGISRPKGTACDIGSYELVPVAAPNAPSGLVLSNILASSITLNWTDNSSDENVFAIERSLDGITWQEINRVGANATTYMDNTVVCDNNYSYRVRAYRAIDGTYSIFSAIATGVMPFCLNADLSLTMSSNSNIPQGGTFDYTITFSNAGPNPAPNGEVKVVLANGILPLSLQASQGSYNLDSGVWTIGQVTENSSAILTLHVRMGSGTYGQNLTSTAEITNASVHDSDSIPNNHSPLEDDWGQSSILVDCTPASAFDVTDGDVLGLIVAIEAANNNACYPGNDTITLAANGHYVLTQIYSQRTGLPPITGNLTIEGNGATIQRDTGLNTPRFRLLYVKSPLSVTLNDMTLQAGFPTYDTNIQDYTQYGGAILNEGSLTITRSNLINNSAAQGGAIANHNGTLIVNDSTLTLNTAVAFAGGILNDGNTAVATVNSTTFDRNASGRAGALANLYGQMTITNSSLFQNRSTYLVDGIETEYGTLIMHHNTIVGTPIGTNLTFFYVSSTIELEANIIETPQTKICEVVGDKPISQGYNLTNGNSLCATLVTGDKINTSAHVGTLGDYGGENQTINLLGNSPALDAIPAGECSLGTDQRGVSRPQFGGCDAGAFEADQLSLFTPILISPANNAELDTQPSSLDWEPITLADHYELQIGMSNPPASPAITTSAISYPLNETPLGITYYWRIRGIDTQGNTTPWSATWGFMILSPESGAPTINSSIIATPTLSWSQVSWALGYEIVIGTDPNFPVPYVEQQDVDANTLTYTTQTLPDGIYYWHVRAKKPDESWGEWSPAQTFIVAKP